MDVNSNSIMPINSLIIVETITKILNLLLITLTPFSQVLLLNQIKILLKLKDLGQTTNKTIFLFPKTQADKESPINYIKTTSSIDPSISTKKY